MTVSATVLATANSVITDLALSFTGVSASLGKRLVAVIAADNNGLSGTSNYGTMTDSAGNTWTKRLDVNRTPGGVITDGTTLAIYDCLVATALSSGTVTVNFANNLKSKCGTIWAFDVTEQEIVEYANSGAGGTGSSASMSTGAFSPGDNVFVIGSAAMKMAAAPTITPDSDTVDGSWGTGSDVIASATSTTSQRSFSQWKLTTGSSNQTWNIVSSSGRDHATGWASYSVRSPYMLSGAEGSGTADGQSLAKRYALAEASGEGITGADRGARWWSEAVASGVGNAAGSYPVEKATTSMDGTLYWQGFPGPAGYIDIPSFGLFPVDVGANLLTLREARGHSYLLRAKLPNEGEVEGFETLYLAASFGRSTSPSDIPPNQYVPGLLLGSTINYGISLFSGIEPVALSSGGSGAIVLLDPKGTIDDLVNRSWDGASLDILQGNPRDEFKTYTIVGKLTTAGILYDQRRKEIRLRDQAWKLEQGRVHDDVYTGEGDEEGDVELKGQYKPIGFGLCRNIEPKLINAARQIRQLSNGPIKSVLQVRDGGAVIAYAGNDYPDYASLAAAVDGALVPAGEYVTCLAKGLIATGSVPVFQLTCDMEGDALVINGTGYSDTLATIARRVAVGRGNVALTDDDIDFATLNRLEQSQPDTCGWWFPGGGDMVSKAAALQEIMNSRLGWWAVRLNGTLAFGVMEEPVGNPVMVINYPSDFSGEPTQLDTYQVPRRSTFLGYRRNYTVQDASAQAGTIVGTPEGVIYSQESQFQGVTSDIPLWKVPTAQDVRVQSGLDDETATQAEAARQQAIMGTRRERWVVPVPCNPFTDLLGRVIEIRNFPRYGWGSSRKFICIGQSFATGIAVQLTLWG